MTGTVQASLRSLLKNATHLLIEATEDDRETVFISTTNIEGADHMLRNLLSEGPPGLSA
jgi:NAD-dependent SIR2 family protein deacetylase